MSTFIRSLGLEITIQLGTVEMLNASEDVVDLALFAVLANKFYCRLIVADPVTNVSVHTHCALRY